MDPSHCIAGLYFPWLAAFRPPKPSLGLCLDVRGYCSRRFHVQSFGHVFQVLIKLYDQKNPTLCFNETCGRRDRGGSGGARGSGARASRTRRAQVAGASRARRGRLAKGEGPSGASEALPWCPSRPGELPPRAPSRNRESPHVRYDDQVRIVALCVRARRRSPPSVCPSGVRLSGSDTSLSE